jgi:transposase
MEKGYKVHLANPAACEQYDGLKNVDDKRSALWLADLLRLGILKTGYIYPKEARSLRDLLRKRLHLVRHRSSHIISVKNILTRSLGIRIKSDEVKKFDEKQVRRLFPDEHLFLAVNASVTMIRHLTYQIEHIEKIILTEMKLRKEFKDLLTLPGIGEILGLTIMLEVGNIGRFEEVGNYVSYCRCVKSIRTSNGKTKGRGNNKYLSWAYIEAAQIARRCYPAIERYYQKKLAKTGKILAIKAVSSKLARATYYVLRDQVAYDEKKLFGGKAEPCALLG